MIRATEQEKLLASLFPGAEDFIYDFEFFPIHCAVLHEYSSLDSERHLLALLLSFAIKVSSTTSKETWNNMKWQYRDRSPLFRELINVIETGSQHENTEPLRFAQLLEQPEALKDGHHFNGRRSWTERTSLFCF